MLPGFAKLLCKTFLVVNIAVICIAQVESGRIVGTVLDPNGAVVAQAKITVTNTATDQTLTATTNDGGDFAVTPLEPGTYNVTVTATGFQTFVIRNVEVQVN